MMLPQDHQSRAEALNPHASFAVTAPAGSGKTGLLTQRVLTLLPLCEHPEEIVCITFTRKAAAEMQQRISDAIFLAATTERPDQPHEQLTWDLAHKVIERDREKQWHLLENPNRLRVQTIDGLCRSLTQHNPIASGIGGSSKLLEHPQVIYRQAVEQAIQSLETEGQLQHDLKELFIHLDNNIEAVINLLVSLLGKRDQWLLPLLSARDKRQYLESVLEQLVNETLEKAYDCLQDVASDLCLLADYAGNNCENDKPESNLCRLKGISELPAPDSSGLNDWVTLIELMLTQTGGWRSSKGLNKTVGFPAGTDKDGKALAKQRKADMAGMLELLSGDESLLSTLQFIRTLPPCHYPHQQWRLLDGLTRIMPHVVIQLKLAFRALNATDFSEITQGALLAMGDEDAPTELTLLLDYQIKHILVDEFQDTASPQLQLLEKLTAGWEPDDGRTLFIVGDGMQSCYGFRDANVGIFLDARNNGIGNVALTPLELTVNFRSQSGVVDWVNEAFEHAFPAEDDISRGAVKYAHSVGFKPALSEQAVTTHVFLDADDRQAEAQKVVALVQQSLSHRPLDRIAILTRNRPHLVDIISALQAADIRWQATDIDPLSSRMSIVDLLSLTRAMLNPADRNSWLALLRSPMIGLDNGDLLQLVRHQPFESTDAHERLNVIFDNLIVHKSISAISADGAHILDRATPLLKLAWENRRRKSLRVWIEGLWVALGGPATLIDKVDIINAGDFFTLLDKFDEGGKILQWDEFSRSVRQLYARPSADADARVQVMTIHKSKGLEFETVIIPGLDRTQRSDDKQLLMWQERINQRREKQLLLSPLSATGEDDDPLYQFLRNEQKIRGALESTRLLYVGCTRAIKHLHLIANLKTDTKTNEVKAPSTATLLAPLWASVKEQAKITQCHPSEQTDDYAPGPLSLIRRLPANWQRPALIPSSLLAPYRGREFEAEDNLVSDDYLRHRAARHTGTVLHRTLAQIVADGVDHWSSERINQQTPFWRSQLRSLGLNSVQVQASVNRIELALHRMLNDTTGQWILDNRHLKSACELSVWSGSPTAHNSIVDRTFIDNDCRWVIDYKSSEPGANQTAQAFFEHEVCQYREQLERYGELFQQEKLTVKTALYFPLLAHFEPVSV